jgi:hypothetical protein
MKRLAGNRPTDGALNQTASETHDPNGSIPASR